MPEPRQNLPVLKPIVDTALVSESSSKDTSSDEKSSTVVKRADADINKACFQDRFLRHGVKAVNMDHLRQCITNIATDSRHIQYFWQDISNIPFWWPSDVPFISPNRRPAHGDYLKPCQIMKIGRSLRQYILLGSSENGNVNREAVHEDDTENVESNGDYADRILSEDVVESDDTLQQQRVSYSAHEASKPNVTDLTSPNAGCRAGVDRLASSCKDVLTSLAHCKSWQSFLTMAENQGDVHQEILACVAGMKHEFTIEDLPARVKNIDSRCTKMKNLPSGKCPIRTTGDGNCLYNSIGISLFGTENVAPILRLASVLAGISHIDHFVDSYAPGLTSMADTVQFIWSTTTQEVLQLVLSRQYNDYHQMLKDAVKAEIMETAKEKSYSVCTNECVQSFCAVAGMSRLFQWPIKTGEHHQRMHECNAVDINMFVFSIILTHPTRIDRVFIADHLLWQRIAKCETPVQMLQQHRRVFPHEHILQKDLLIFACNISEKWHWVSVAISLKNDGWVAVLDSLGCQSSNDAIADTFVKYVAALRQTEHDKPVPKLKIINSMVPKQQNGLDCGLITLHNIKCLARNEFKVTEQGVEVDGDFRVADSKRIELISKIYQLQ
eukprot:gene19108-21024_t